ncbi:glucose-6-phosphate dehydrogenase [Flavihumibacter fluvii]|uniref:glucose-6-phosphate dehydrogenase n=1 Tax=Flavihumibacter fluvii TaxID=2838157 RepID=UPI001BDE4CFB|nr:glucose-6-phosphate dehydrogenase [Flavihumibacter fluvii]ULQ53059.1 glucose-6-phosphate dehydrogenase [Flavihumibacter fluvii]
MAKQSQTFPAGIVIFGAKGDLTRRKLIPALYNLYQGKFLPETFRIYCVDYISVEEAGYKADLRSGVDEFSRNGKTTENEWLAFADHIEYQSGDFLKAETFVTLKSALGKFDISNKKRGRRIFYYAVSPRFIETISEALYRQNICNQDNLDRIVIEKPFGTDLTTARLLNRFLQKRFAEKQIYRIDHYLGKETVQNIMAFRFANYVFEPLWNNRFVDHVEISVTEKVSVGARGGYYDSSGALRDMVQNHILQLLCVTAMECPKEYEAEAIRTAKNAVIKNIRPVSGAQVFKQVVRGQYKGYKKEDHVASSSTTETYVAAKLFIDNKRWKGVPFFLRTGKSLTRQSTTIIIQFKHAPLKIFKDDIEPNRLIISIQPELEISLLFESKVPGLQMKLKPVEMDFTYKESYTEAIPEAYEALILDVLKGDPTLFMRADQVESAWQVVMPILEAWQKQPAKELHQYIAGTEGPTAAVDLLKPFAKTWTGLPEQQKT